MEAEWRVIKAQLIAKFSIHAVHCSKARVFGWVLLVFDTPKHAQVYS